MAYVIVYIIAFIFFLGAPLPLQIIFMIANIFNKDPIPVIDEVMMGVSILKKIATILGIIDFLEDHPIVLFIIVVAIIIAIIALAKYFLFL